MGKVLEVVERLGRREDKLLEILIAVQDASVHNYLCQEDIMEVADLLDISMTKVYGIAEFYAMLSTKKRGRHVIQICQSAPCHLKEGEHVVNLFEEILGIAMGEMTQDGLFSLEYTSCIGACDQAPAARIDDMIYGHLDRSKIYHLISELKGGSHEKTTL